VIGGKELIHRKITKVTKIKPGYLPRNYVLDADIVPGEAGSL
jgi:hypothetical protein